ncbi:hypothetical protein LOTGIDRAFT_175840 [Lottia gigantea]|uniref:DNA-directed DNA polymerase n=1 Tax=Lottia gigantea TaxID=225164 RepID=V4A060_LOTGI|nr:hypothetical protein LOTGIDRAFT_175840 [Lottia gigantea]ESO90032.1 hypothetical protein LOTGIDRAFT_175840 [Lottia gigantea]
MTCARMNEFNKKFNTSFQIYNPKNRHFHPRDVHDELDWVLYLHNSHFCLIRRSQKSLGIQEIEDNYEQVWKTCRDDNAVSQVSPLKLNVLSSMSDDALFAWDCEMYSEKDMRRAIPYACTLINLEKLRKMLNRINNLFPDLKPTDPIPEEFYDKLMNVVEIFKKWKRQKEIKGNYVQHINFTCSYQHESSSLAAWGNSSNLPANLRKIADVDIAKYTQDNWEELRHEWEPYAKRDTLCLGACLIKYNQVTKEVVNQNMSNNLTAPSLSLKGWYYLYYYDKEMVEEEWYETTRMVAKHTEKENIEKVYSHTNPFIRKFIRRSIKGGRVSANRKSFETNKMDEICNVLKEYTELESNNIIDLFKEYSASTKDKTEVHSRLKKIECTKLMAFDANGLYASAMSDLDSEYPRAESGRPFLPEEEKEFVKLFNKQKFRPRTAILTVWFDYPKNMFFQPIPAKDKITFTNKEAPKVKYNIVLTSDGVLKEKKTFKGYSNDKISVEDYVQLASGHDVSNEFNKPWEKSFTNGVVIPNDKQTKVFRSYLNNVKRKPPNSEGIMSPYNDKDEYSFDENYEFDDFDYLSNQEENEDCFK